MYSTEKNLSSRNDLECSRRDREVREWGSRESEEESTLWAKTRNLVFVYLFYLIFKKCLN